MKLPPELTHAPKYQQDHYLSMMSDGQSEQFAIMCSLQQPPGTKGTERAFMQGRYNGEWLNDMPAHQAKYMLAEAKAAGISTNGRYYCSGIANKLGWCDERAWIEDSGDMLKVAKERNLEVKGSVNYTPPEREPERKSLAKDVVNDLAKREMKKNPKMTKAEAKSKVKEKHTPRWAKGRQSGNK
jgi:hypothetical protein